MKEKNAKTDHVRQKKKQGVDRKWTAFVFLFSFALAALMYLLSEEVLSQLNIIAAFLILVLIVAIGILFDILGIAVTTAKEEPFHAMAANRHPEGKAAVKIIRNAARISNFCNDVIGDIAGVVSGAAAAAVAAAIFTSDYAFWGKMLITATISAMTVGGKAIGKGFAIRYSKNIVQMMAKARCLFKKNS